MRTRTYTTDQVNRFLVLDVDKPEDLNDIERFVGRSFARGEEDQPLVRTPSGDIPIHVGDHIVFTNGQAETEIAGEIYAQPYVVFNDEMFKGRFQGAKVVR